MIEVKNTNGKISLVTGDKVNISIETQTNSVYIEDFDVSYPWEYEKSGILLEVKEYADKLFYHFLIDTKHVVIINSDKFDLKEEIVSFFGDVDVLFITGSKESAKIFENIEAKVVIPFGEGKDLFLNTLGQHIEEVKTHKVKSDLPIDSTEFVNLEIA